MQNHSIRFPRLKIDYEENIILWMNYDLLTEILMLEMGPTDLLKRYLRLTIRFFLHDLKSIHVTIGI